MLRIRSAPQADANVIEIILPASFPCVTFEGLDVGDFWEVARPTGRGYVIKVYEGYRTLAADSHETNAIEQPVRVQVESMTGELVFGPTEVSRSITIARLKNQLEIAAPSWTSYGFQLVLGQTILHDDDPLSSIEAAVDETVTLTLIQLNAYEQWGAWAASSPLCHNAYGDGGMVRMRLVFQAPIMQDAPEDGQDYGDQLSIEQFKSRIACWPISDRRTASRRGQSNSPTLVSRLQDVSSMAEHNCMDIFCCGELVWGPRWECCLRKGGLRLTFAIHQNVISCDLD